MSIKHAAAELSVTPGAVSHQIKLLEESLGIHLFIRRNNSIDLTQPVSLLFQQSTPGFDILNAALGNVSRDANELRIQVSMSLATRWLIPKLDSFKKQNRTSRVRLETVFEIDQRPSPEADVTIGYCKRHELHRDAQVLFEDICRPYLSPTLISEISDLDDLASIPALQCAEGNWDWRMWLADSGLTETRLNFTEHFDLDDSALRAAVAGMGMVLTSPFMIEDEIADGRLCPLPRSTEAKLGFYTLQTNGSDTGLSRRFLHWLGEFEQH